jgi:hypothetical protein
MALLSMLRHSFMWISNKTTHTSINEISATTTNKNDAGAQRIRSALL